MSDSSIIEAVRSAIFDDAEDSIMVGDVIIVAEIFPEDGEATMMSVSNVGLPIWKELGMLEFRSRYVGRAIEYMADGKEDE